MRLPIVYCRLSDIKITIIESIDTHEENIFEILGLFYNWIERIHY